MEFFGGCSCGAVRYRARGQPHDIVNCHCDRCRRSAGAPFVPWATFKADQFEFVGDVPKEYRSSPLVARTFCSVCGTSLTNRNVDQPDEVFVNICSLDNAESIRPERHIWVSRQLSWVCLVDDLPRMEEDDGSGD